MWKNMTHFFFSGFVFLVYLVDPRFFPVLGKNVLFKLQHYKIIHYMVEEIASQLHFETEVHSLCRLGWTPSLFSSWAKAELSSWAFHAEEPCLGPMCPFARFGHLSKEQSLLQDAVSGSTTPVVPDSLAKESAVQGALREADQALIYLDICKVGLQLGRNGCCLLHRQHLLLLI